MTAHLKARTSQSPAAGPASARRSPSPVPTRAPTSSSPTTAWRWTAATRRARSPTPSSPRSRPGRQRCRRRRRHLPVRCRRAGRRHRRRQLGSIDGVVCPAGVLRERMLFNMSEDEWDHVVAVHLKGHFNVYRAAFARMRKQETGGSLVGFTSGAFTASRRRPTIRRRRAASSASPARRPRPASLRMRGGPAINANCIAPVAKPA